MSLRRVLSWIAIAALAAAFILLCLVMPLKINIVYPLILFAVAIVLFFAVKKMPSDLPDDDAGAKPQWKRVDGEKGGEDGK